MCLITQRMEPCSHAECHLFYSSLAENNSTLLSTEALQFISSHLTYQTNLLTQLAQNNQEIEELLSSVSSSIRKLQMTASFSANSDFVVEESTQIDTIFEDILKNEYSYTIELNSSLPSAVFKERGFCFSVCVKSSDRNNAVFMGNNRFSIALFTMDSPPKLLKLNIVGKKIIRGTKDAQMDENGVVSFNNVVINEVSSHYFNEAFHLVVYHVTAANVKPLIVNDFRVRARTAHK